MPTLQNLSTIVGELTQATESKKKKIPNYVLADNVSTEKVNESRTSTYESWEKYLTRQKTLRTLTC